MFSSQHEPIRPKIKGCTPKGKLDRSHHDSRRVITRSRVIRAARKQKQS